MEDMRPEQLASCSDRDITYTYHDGTSRKLLVIDQEVPYPDGKLIVSRTDTQGRITHANPAFVEMSGYNEDELIGQPHAILRHPDMPRAAFADLWATLKRGERWQGYVKNLRGDGKYYWVFAVVIPNIRHGEITGYSSIRRKPSRSKIEAAIRQYAAWRASE